MIMNRILICFVMIFFCQNTVFAVSTESFTITGEMCPSTVSVSKNQLRCPTYRQTTNYTCGPAVVMELMHYYGRAATREMNRSNEMRYASEMGTNESTGTSVTAVANYLRNHGFNVQTGQNVTSDLIISNLARGIPTLVAMNGHWLLAKGYDSSGIFFADSCCGTQIIPKNIIDGAWADSQLSQNRHCHVEKGYYIVATPE